jgi:hypothetical protein
MTAMRRKAMDLMAVALDERNSSGEERTTAAFAALRLISKYGLLDPSRPTQETLIERLTSPDRLQGIKDVVEIFSKQTTTGGRRRRYRR